MRKPVIIGIFLSLGLLLNLNSQVIRDTLELEEVRIVRSRSIREGSLKITSIDTCILRNEVGSCLSELLARHTGIYIKSAGRGAVASASFRGTDPSHTKVSWNGIEMNSPMLGMVDFSLVPMLFTDKVELYHGSSSLAHSSGALGGMISLGTGTDWNNRFSGMYSQGVGSFGSHDENLKVSYGNQKVQLQSRIFYSHSDNDFSYINKDVLDSLDRSTGEKYYPRVKNRDAWFSNYGILQEIYYRPGEKDYFSAGIWLQESSRSIPLLTTRESGDGKNINRQEDQTGRAFLSYRHYSKRIKISALSGLSASGLDYRQMSRVSSDNYYIQVQSTSKFTSLIQKAELQFSPGRDLDIELEAGVNHSLVSSFEKVKLQGYDKARFQANIRGAILKRWNNRLNSGVWAGIETAGWTEVMPVWMAASEWRILPGDLLYIRTRFASNVRFPSLNDLYYQPWGNPSLRPEKSNDQEVGVHFGMKKSHFEVRNELSGYHSGVNNWIMWKYTSYGFFPENIEKVDIRGFEYNTNFLYQIMKTSFRLTWGYTFTRSRDLGNPVNAFDLSYGKQLPFIPVHSMNSNIQVDSRDWLLSYLFNYYSPRYTTSSNSVNRPEEAIPSYFMHEISLGKQIQFRIFEASLNLRVHNLLNSEYRSVLQRQMPGRNYSVQLKVDF